MQLSSISLGVTRGGSVSRVPAAPSNVVAPVITGHDSDGSTMTSTSGSWSGYPSPTYAYQWKSAGTNVGTNQNSYITQAGDIGKSITCTVTATNTQGNAAQASNGITVTTSAAPANTVAPVVSGNQPAGSTMTSTNGTWTANPDVDTYSYQWKADAGNVGTDQATYVTQVADVGKSITCTVTATNRKGSTAQQSNGITVTAALTVPANTVAPVVSGNQAVGSTMTSTTGTWTGNPSPTYSYQWKSDGSNVGTDQNTYVSQSSDAGKSITCVVTATNSQGSTAQSSNGISMAALAAPVNTVAPAVSGDQPDGSTLTSTTGTWTANPAVSTYAYQWKADATNVGTNQNTYVTQTGDVGKSITCTVTATNSQGSVAQASNGITVTANNQNAVIEALFANGEEGVWYDPSDLSTMFQDSAGTTPVTADGQPVGKILDKSGRGNHASQATAAARPLYKTDGTYHWLQFDGVDDSLSTAAIDFSGTNKMSSFAGVFKNTNAVGLIAELSDSFYVNNGSFGMLKGDSGGSNYVLGCRGSGSLSYYIVTPYAAPIKNTIAMLNDLSKTTLAEAVVVRVNNLPDTSGGSGSVPGGGMFGTWPLNIGRRSGASFNGNIYSLIVRGALSATQEITDTETWVNSKTGAF